MSYHFENGSCCGLGIVNRAYQVLEEYTVLLRDGSKEEVPLGCVAVLEGKLESTLTVTERPVSRCFAWHFMSFSSIFHLF